MYDSFANARKELNANEHVKAGRMKCTEIHCIENKAGVAAGGQ